MIHWRRYLLGGLSLFLLFLAIKKAATAPITWDEAFTYFEFIRPVKMYPGAGGGMAANNHLLNTWLSYLFTSLIGVSEFTLRLGNVLFFAFYLIASSWLACRAKNTGVTLAVFSLLNFNPYLFDFFCLSRGYGIAHVCLLLSIVCLHKHFQSRQCRWLNLMLIFSMTGMLAGAMLLPAFGMLYAVVFFIIPFYENALSVKLPWKTNLLISLKRVSFPVHVIFLFSLLSGMAYLILMQKFNAFLFGGNQGVFDDMILSVLKNSSYNSKVPLLFYLPLFLPASIVLLQGTTGQKVNVLKNSHPINKTASVLLLIIAGIILSSAVLFFLFSTPLPTERTALYIYLLFALTLSFYLLLFEMQSVLLKPICMISGLLLMMHFVLSFNTKTYHDWITDADAPLMIHDLRSAYMDGSSEEIISIASLELELPLKFYLAKDETMKNKISIKRIGTPVEKADLYFLDKSDSNLALTFKMEKGWSKKYYPQGSELIYRPVILK